MLSENLCKQAYNGITAPKGLTNDDKIPYILLRELYREYKYKEIPEEIFSVNYVEEFNKIIKNFPVKVLNEVAVEGISEYLMEYINELSEEEYKIWLDYHFKNCERKDLIGYSSHVMCICEK